MIFFTEFSFSFCMLIILTYKIESRYSHNESSFIKFSRFEYLYNHLVMNKFIFFLNYCENTIDIDIASLFYFSKNYMIVKEIILFTMSISYKIKISHGISWIYLHQRPTWTIKTSKIYITKS